MQEIEIRAAIAMKKLLECFIANGGHRETEIMDAVTNITQRLKEKRLADIILDSTIKSCERLIQELEGNK